MGVVIPVDFKKGEKDNRQPEDLQPDKKAAEHFDIFKKPAEEGFLDFLDEMNKPPKADDFTGVMSRFGRGNIPPPKRWQEMADEMYFKRREYDKARYEEHLKNLLTEQEVADEMRFKQREDDKARHEEHLKNLLTEEEYKELFRGSE